MSPDEQPPPKNAWRSLGKFCRSTVGVVTIVAGSLSTAAGVGIAVGGRVLRAVELPPEMAASIAALEARHALDVSFRDSVFQTLAGRDAKLDSIMSGIQLFFDLYRCTEAGYPPHNCPLLGDNMGIEPLAPADRQPTLGPGPQPERRDGS